MNKKVVYLPTDKTLDPIKENPFFIKYENPNYLDRTNFAYDFADEWNNYGYGKIPSDRTKWSISNPKLTDEGFTQVLGTIVDIKWNMICVYCAIKEENGSAKLIFNREAGPVDGLDFYIIEDFLLNYKSEEFGSHPILSEIPYGYNGAVTMRLDCDESIKSAKRLFDLYQKKQVPFSLAIATHLEIDSESKDLITEVVELNGAIVSHSHTHAPHWGGSIKSAMKEYETSKKILKKVLPKDYTFDYVVSPFHQNPQAAVQGLVQAGVKGFIGGSIKYDPEYLQSRAGLVSTGEKIITHSQQCMLHGDCYKQTGLEVYKQTFLNHLNTNTFFGYLDHPFSDYTYGWDSEEQRIAVHRELIDFMQSHSNIWFANLIESMNFLWVKAHTKVWVEGEALKWEIPKHQFKIPNMKVFWKNQEIEIK